MYLQNNEKAHHKDPSISYEHRVRLTPYQAIFYYEWLQNPLRDDYNMIMDTTVIGDLDEERSREGFSKLVTDHLLLSSNPVNGEDGFYWKTRNPLNPQLDFYHHNLTDDEIYDIISTPFDLEKDQLIKLNIIKVEEYKYRIIFVISHLVIDGIKTQEIYDKWVGNYNYKKIETPSFEEQRRLHEELNISFQEILTKNKTKIEDFWKRRLQDVSGLDLTFLKSNVQKPKSAQRFVSECIFHYDESVVEKVKGLRYTYKITPYIFGQMVLAVLMHRISGQKNIGLVYPIAIMEGKDLIYGAHVNSLIIDYRFNEDTTISSLIDEALNFFKELKVTKARYLPVPEIAQYATNLGVLEVGFAQTFLRDVTFDMDGVVFDKVNHKFQIDLVNKLLFEQEQYENHLNYRVKFDKDILDETLVSEFVEMYQKLFDEMLNDLLEQNGERKINTYHLIGQKQYDRMIGEWNQTQKPYSSEKTVIQLFEEQASKTPQNIAIIYNNTKLTYEELNRRSNQLAYYLKDKYNIKPDDLIGLCLNRSEHMIVAILAVLKSGGAYVPVDPSMPDDRIAYMLEDACVKALIGDEENENRLKAINENVETVDSAGLMQSIDSNPYDNFETDTLSNNLAYVIYTSGTTGKPKGVMVEHKSINRLIVNANYVSVNESDKILSLSGYQFDGSIYDFFAALLNGASVVISTKEVFLDLNELNNLIEKNGVTNFFITTALFNSIVDANLSGLKNLRYLLYGGEKASVSHVARFKENYPSVNLMHVYGPTETTTYATAYPVGSDVGTFSNVPIGRPLTNTTLYVLDQNLQPLPIGAVGELYIGGPGVARGYLNHPELTAERFLVNPFQTKEDKEQGVNDRIYKTGDLVRFSPEGDIEYIGRNDFQVKIRGFRIELGEIEASLSSYPGINQSIVLAKEHTSGTKYIIGYYMSETKPNDEDLRKHLEKVLPDFMVPSVLVHLTEFPLNSNGKIDRNALPEAEFTNKFTYVAPENELERQLCEIYGQLLGIESSEISVQDDFYKLGGNSILAIKLVSKINKELDKDIHVSAFFNHKNIRQLSRYIQQGEKNTVKITKIKVTKPEEQLLSFAQERLWFIESYEKGSSAYNVPMIFEIQEKVNLYSLQESIRTVVYRHEVLRSLIKTSSEGRGYQVVMDYREKPLKFEYHQLDTKEELVNTIIEAVNKIFDLENEYPLQVKIYTFDRRKYMSIVIHHIAFDGWSVELFIKEIWNLYNYYQSQLNGGKKGNAPGAYKLPEITIQYKDFALWQRNYLQGEVLDKQLNFWREQLGGYETLNLPLDKPRPAHVDYAGADIEFILDREISMQLREVAKQLNVTMYSLLLGGYYLLLSAYSSQKDIVVGTPVAGRHYPQINDTIGFFVNTLVIRQNIENGQPIASFIQSIASYINSAQNNQDLPFEKLVEELNVEKDLSRHPIIQVMFGVQSFGSDQIEEVSPLFKLYRDEVIRDYKVAKFDLTTMLDDSQECISGVFNYATSLFTEDTIKNYISAYTGILKQFCKLVTDNLKIGQITYLDNNEYQKIILDWNFNKKPYSEEKTITQLFEEQVAKTPDNIAVRYNDTELTYGQLNERANMLAAYLVKTYNVKVDDLVAICLNRSEYMLVSILAVLKSGAAYVPIDPTMPDDRILYMIKDAGVKAMLTDIDNKERIKSLYHNVKAVNEDGFLKTLHWGYSQANLNVATRSNNLAYVIYTSGTTGKPKGVMVEHKSVNRLIVNANYILVDESDNVLSLSGYQFDGSIYDFFAPLLNGATLVISTKDVFLDLKDLNSLIDTNNITNFFITTSLFNSIVDAELPALKNLKYILFGGEKASLKHVAKLKKTHPHVKTVNVYGPTETTTYATTYSVGVDIDSFSSVPIGYPITNTTTYILDENLNPLPVGAVGELYIGGPGVARGYLNRPELTTERFLVNPFQTNEDKYSGYNGKIYKTGDLARYSPDGCIEYIGRNDFQVKIRGFRIELGEIETSLVSYPGIKQAVVLAKDHASGTKYLVAYYVSERILEDDVIRNYLEKELPDFMVPSVLIHLNEFPVTVNGKLDRKALPEPQFTDKSVYVAPENEMEEQLCIIYGEVLGLDGSRISIHDDFFKLGGDSISSIQLVNRIRQRLNMHVEVKDIFAHKTISLLYNNVIIKSEGVNHKIRSEQGLLSGKVNMLPIQEWFFYNLEEGLLPSYNHWNQSFVIKVPRIDKRIFEISVKKLIEHHDSFRLNYSKVAGSKSGYEQYYMSELPEITVDYANVKDLSPDEIEILLTNWQNNFDIFDRHLFHIGCLNGYADGFIRIHFALHHLIIDAVSWRIIKDDLETIYQYLLSRKDEDIERIPVLSILGTKGTSYRQWVQSISEYKQSDIDGLRKEKAYWESVISDLAKSNELLQNQGKFPSYQTEIYFDKSNTNLLLQKVNQVYGTEINDVLLTALAKTLASFTGNPYHHIVLEGHGREDLSPEVLINNTMGWFTTMYPVRLLFEDDDLGTALSLVKNTLRQIPNKGVGYGALIGYTQTELPNICFNYLGQFETVDADSKTQWSFSKDGSGLAIAKDNRDRYMLNINGGIIDGQLQFSVSGRLGSENLVNIADSFKKNLILLIEYLASEKRTYLTVSDTGFIISQDYLDHIQHKREIDGVYHVNSLQEGFIYHATTQGEIDDAYRVHLVWDYFNVLDVDKLKKAWMYAQQKFETLRLRFAWQEELVQIIDKEGILDWGYENISSLSESDRKKYLDNFIEENRKLSFDLQKGLMFRIRLIKQDDKHYSCMLSNHHAILDGWSGVILLNYVHETYVKLINNRNVDIIPDRSYSIGQKYLQEHRLENVEYWRTQVDKLEQQEDLSTLLKPELKSQVILSDYKHIKHPKEKNILVNRDIYHKIKAFCNDNGFTVNAFFHYCWHRQLSLYGASETTVVGTTVSGRNISVDGIEQSVGLYINTLPIIVNHESQSVVRKIQDVQNQINEANSYSDISLALLQKEGKRLFNTLFVFENYPMPKNGEVEKVLDVKFAKFIEKLDYPIGVAVYESNEEISLSLKYASELFDEEMIDQLLDGINFSIEEILKKPQAETCQLRHLSLPHYSKVVLDWNKTDKSYPSDITVKQMFEDQVERTPDNIAIVYEGTSLTYAQLNAKANRFAKYLSEQYRIKPEDLIVLCLDRSLDMLITMLAVIKAGAAYIPVSPDYPDDRIAYVMDDAKTNAIITNSKYVERIKSLDKKASVVAVENEYLWNSYPAGNFISHVRPDNLVYVIYTSGTTGHPKGVMIEHRNLVSLVHFLKDEFNLDGNPPLNCIWYANYVFDAHVWELYVSILFGNTSFILPEDSRTDIELLDKYISDHSISLATLSPSLLNDSTILKLKTLIVAGEVTNPDVMMAYTAQGVKVVNAYGPTEATVCGTLHHYKAGDSNTNIGKPIANAKVYVLDKYLNPLPVGAVGELYLGGDKISRGYLNRPELTTERFIPNPFHNNNSRIYKTGDLVKYMPDGSLEYMGRNDFQVKIRGFRIELGEIESCLRAYKGLENVVVLARQSKNGNNKYLVAYYIADNAKDEDLLREYILSQLPDYMVPSFFIHLEKLPLTINGKLDRKALPEPELMNEDLYKAPENEIEEQLVDIYSQLLDINSSQISVEDDFYKLGGNSILAIRLVGKINKELNKNIHVSKIYSYRTVRKLAQYIQGGEEEPMRITKMTVSKPEDQLLSFAQERLWFIESFEEGSSAYNIPMVFEIKDSVDLNSLQEAIRIVVNRHEVLRSLIKTSNEGFGYQVAMDDKIYPLIIDENQYETQEQLDTAIGQSVNKVFDLENEYPINVQVYNLHNRRYMSIVVHHIAFDGWSAELFIKEIWNLYNYYNHEQNESRQDRVSQTYELPAISIQYKDFALWQRNYLKGNILNKQLNFWKEQLGGYETLNLPTDKPRPALVDYSGADVEFTLDRETSMRLRKMARELNVTMFTLLLGGYYVLLSAYSSQKDILVGTMIAGRHYPEITDTIGFFVNTLVLRQHIDNKQAVSNFIKQIGEKMELAQKNQDLPFEKLVEELNVKKDLSRHPVFQVMFGVQSFGRDQMQEAQGLFEPYKGNEHSAYQAAKFDITTTLDDSQECISGVFNYATSLFTEDTIRNYIATYTQILKQLAVLSVDNDILENIAYLSKEETEKITFDWNQTEKSYDIDKTISQLFEEQVERTPANIAMRYEGISLTYAQLNESANRLAGYLIDTYHMQPDDLVTICLDRSEHMLATILGVLKSGAAYVPVDPNMPDDRIAYIFENTKTKVVLSSRVYSDKITQIAQEYNVSVICIDDSDFIQNTLTRYNSGNIRTGTTPDNLAYVIYTSGTTGKPKGAMIEHRSVANRIMWMNDQYPLMSTDKILQKTTYTFDVSVWELFWANWYGACIVFAHPQDYKDNLYLLDLIEKEEITVMHFVPSMLAAFEESLSNEVHLQSKTKSLRYLFCSGEALTLSHVKKYHELVPGCEIHNLYGPTEATVDVLYYDCNNKDISKVFIGRPISNTTAYVLDESLRPLPVGALGELYIGGINVGRGYLNNPVLTDERFLLNPFSGQSEYNGRIYKTGDVVKYHADGNIEYIGRNDFQVKVRGFRIELGEIETCLTSCNGINQAVVLAKDHASGSKYLVGYYVSEEELDNDAIRRHLEASLPEYMVPSIFVHLKELPLTGNGKLNRNALPEPEFTDKRTYIAPENDAQRQLCDIYGEVLGLDPQAVSISDDFYGLGGNSILAIRLVYKINAQFNIKIRITDILGSKSIQDIALLISGNISYKAIVELNSAISDKTLFMVHPGVAGCEVYAPLAEKLSSYYHCYGVDSYNLYHNDKIDKLSQLAGYYLGEIEKNHDEGTPYYLLGWSLGGQIALEMASILEAKGEKNISVFLLDTWLVHIKDSDESDASYFMDKFNIPEENRQMVISVMEMDNIITKQPISNNLNHTKVVLFKAMDNVNSDHADINIGQYPYNNVDSCLNSPSLLKLVEIGRDHHGIIDEEDVLIQHIV